MSLKPQEELVVTAVLGNLKKTLEDVQFKAKYALERIAEIEKYLPLSLIIAFSSSSDAFE